MRHLVLRGDLVRALHTTAKGTTVDGVVRKFDHVIIETTGLADPHPIANVLLDTSTGLPPLFGLHAVVTVVDAVQFGRAMDDVKPTGTCGVSTLN